MSRVHGVKTNKDYSIYDTCSRGHSKQKHMELGSDSRFCKICRHWRQTWYVYKSKCKSMNVEPCTFDEFIYDQYDYRGNDE